MDLLDWFHHLVSTCANYRCLPGVGNATAVSLPFRCVCGILLQYAECVLPV